MGDQVREETRCAEFSADQCTEVFGGDMPIFRLAYHSFYICLFSFKQPTGKGKRPLTGAQTRMSRFTSNLVL